MSLCTIQGLHSSTFSPPPNTGDGFNTLTALHDFHARYSPKHPVFRYVSGNDERSIRTIFWCEAVRAFCAASKLVKALVKSDAICPVVSILASLDTITYFALVEGIMRAGYTAFPISTRNSDVAVAHLLKSTDSKFLFVSPDVAMQDLASRALSRLAYQDGLVNGEAGKQIDIFPTPVFEDLFQKTALNPEPSEVTDMESIAIILHSSGSTSFPKIIRISHCNFLNRGKGPYYGDIDYCGEILSIAGIPMYHGMGIHKMPEMALTGVILATFPPLNPPITPTTENILHAAVTTKSTMISTVPSILEQWAKNTEQVQILKAIKRVQISGGPLTVSVGDMLVRQGINVAIIYASQHAEPLVPEKPTKMPIARILPEGWNYLTLGTMLDPVLVRSPEDGHNIFRLVVKKCKTHSPAVFNTTVDDQPAYDTNDLLVRHATNPNVFRIHGTAADQIMHSTGEKTNPGPIEQKLMEDEKIALAVMFGREKTQAGVLILPSPMFEFDPEDLEKLSEYRNLIWETVFRINKEAPQHSRIVKELIIVTNPSKPLKLTPKGTLRRQPSLKAYHDEIEGAYKTLEEGGQRDTKPPTTWDLPGINIFVSEIVSSSLGFEVDENDNIFRVGADSLIATYIRNTLTRGLREAHIVPPSAVKALPLNFVYDNPSISSLTKFVFGILSSVSLIDGGDENQLEEDEESDFEPQYQWPKMGQVGHTILQVRKGKGEPPLIVIHGVGGRVDGMVHFQEKFRSALWLVQATPDLPKESLRGDALFYYHKVKEIRPHGPYRLATYSGTHLLGFLIVEMMLNDGEEVTQLSLIDHTPSMMFSGINQDSGFTFTDNFDIMDKETRQCYKERMIYGYYELGAREDRAQVQSVFMDAWQGADPMEAWQGRSAPDHYVQMARMAKIYTDQTWDFVAQLPDYQNSNQQSGSNPWHRMLFAVEKWLKGIQPTVPVNLYVASRGPIAGVKDPVERERWGDLGIRRCFPNAKVIHVEAGHATILWNEIVIKDLQSGYI
ncbi:hypothetical protein GYMLUDRAFT_247153 [Collybiopsis luxurians FD-317 M1]|uniref:AMP-dependent synthetase/ligase domain-containing protein n=1 Tax=Collybiopsis luxurians FD-317 M1 TaxID=944289 RepID=A0A0D0CGA1_9AGAR|nr:hypothetical protein GYMLUDRAFT_247153 [Collybiopsis luxurians FD-317 M1]